MFFDKQSADEFFQSLNEELQKQYSFEDDLQNKRAEQLNFYLSKASENLQALGLVKEANMVNILNKFSADKATKNLTPEKMMNNLKEYGWVFHNPDSCTDDDCAYCNDKSPEPQLSQAELKTLRKLLKK